MAYEEPTFERITTFDGRPVALPKKVELREYEAMLVAEVTIQADDWYFAARQAFRPLANFIFGTNQSDEKIGMTTPVTTHGSADNQWTVAFVMPKRYDETSLPKPYGSSIDIHKRPANTVAAIRFSGRVSGKAGARNFERAEKRLRDALSSSNLQPVGSAIYAIYNGPFTPFFLRRNEVLIRIQSKNNQAKANNNDVKIP